MDSNSEKKPVVVFTGNTWQSGMVASLLESASIKAYLLDTSRGTFNPGWNLPGEDGSVRVAVSSLDAEDAKMIVEDYTRNLDSK